MSAKTPAEHIVKALRASGQSLSVAESLTGGGLGVAITSVPGSSDVFVGGLTAYQATIKVRYLKVPASVIEEFGVVSEEVAVAMAQGALKFFATTWAIATTGVAGPGEADGHSAGTVWVAIAGPVSQSTQLQIQGDRDVVRNATVSSAITAFARILEARE